MKTQKKKGNENRLAKGEEQQVVHQGGPSVSKKSKAPHRRDEHGAENTTKKQRNSI